MKQLNLLELIKILSSFNNGIEDFSDFLRYFDSTNGRFIKLWEFMNEENFENTPRDKRRAFKILSQNNKLTYDPGKISRVFQRYAEWLHQFILLKKAAIDPLGSLLHAKIYEEQGFSEQMEEAISEALEKALSSEEYKSYNLQANLYAQRYFKGNEMKDLEESMLDLKKGKEALYTSFFLLRFKIMIEELTYCRGKELEVSEAQKEEFRTIVKLLPKNPIPLIVIQKHAVEYYLSPSRDAYNTFKNSYFGNVDLIGSEKKYLLNSLINTLTIKSMPNEDGRQEYISLYRFGIKRNIFIEDGSIESQLFNNIVFTAEGLSEYDLIGQLIEKQGAFIKDKKERKKSLLLAKAYLLFGKKHYLEALETLDKLPKNSLSPTFVLRKHLLVFKCTYEAASTKYDAYLFMKEKENSFRTRLLKYDRKGHITKVTKRNCQNFFNLLCKIGNQRNVKHTKTFLVKELNAYEGQIVELKWIHSKIMELKD